MCGVMALFDSLSTVFLIQLPYNPRLCNPGYKKINSILFNQRILETTILKLTLKHILLKPALSILRHNSYIHTSI